MICEICRETIATVHLTEIVNNSKKEIHLCENCAQKKGVAIQSHVKNLSIPEFFGQLVESKEGEEGGGEDHVCPRCGYTYAQFRSSGKLGCPHDYEVFGEELEQLLERIHQGPVQHRGKVPGRIHDAQSRKKELEELKQELRIAVEKEEYEMAASLRDRIHQLEGS